MKDLTGMTFGKLHVICADSKDNRGEYKWMCECECGNRSVVYGSHLRNGATISCGCVMRTTQKTHGESKTRLYKIWQHMKDRCTNQNCDSFEYYGGRGITFCEEWSRYENFRDWALINGYQDTLSIDRIDPDGNYEPKNCRWITQTEQNKNTRKCVLLTHNGETHTLREWGRILGIPKSTIQSRYQRGVSIFE